MDDIVIRRLKLVQNLDELTRVLPADLEYLKQDRWADAREAYNAEARVVAALKYADGLGDENFPVEFWKTDIGKVLAQAQYRLHGHEYMRLAEAWALLNDRPVEDYNTPGNHRGQMNELYAGPHPKLTLYCMPDTKYPYRLRRSEVMRYKENPPVKYDRVARQAYNRERVKDWLKASSRPTEREMAAALGVSQSEVQRLKKKVIHAG